MKIEELEPNSRRTTDKKRKCTVRTKTYTIGTHTQTHTDTHTQTQTHTHTHTHSLFHGCMHIHKQIQIHPKQDSRSKKTVRLNIFGEFTFRCYGGQRCSSKLKRQMIEKEQQECTQQVCFSDCSNCLKIVCSEKQSVAPKNSHSTLCDLLLCLQTWLSTIQERSNSTFAASAYTETQPKLPKLYRSSVIGCYQEFNKPNIYKMTVHLFRLVLRYVMGDLYFVNLFLIPGKKNENNNKQNVS